MSDYEREDILEFKGQDISVKLNEGTVKFKGEKRLRPAYAPIGQLSDIENEDYGGLEVSGTLDEFSSSFFMLVDGDDRHYVYYESVEDIEPVIRYNPT